MNNKKTKKTKQNIPRLNTGNTTKRQYEDINNVAFYAAILHVIQGPAAAAHTRPCAQCRI
jgi:hypothetical protein